MGFGIGIGISPLLVLNTESGSVPVNTITPVITGNTTLNSLLSSTTGTWIGTAPITYSYQWKRNGNNIIGANSNIYTIQVADSGAALTCEVIATNSNGSASATSNTITANTFVAPTNTIAPVLSGTAQEGQTLTTSTGTWTGTPVINYTYQWKRNGSNIGSATNSTYTLVTADVGQSIKCTVTATNILGSASADSNTVTPTASTDADAQAFITAAGITDNTQKSAINQLVIDLKGYSIWTKFKAIYPIVGGSATSHKWNLKDPRDLDAAYRLLFSSGWTHSSTGMTPSNAYADAIIAPNAMAQNSGHLSFYSRTNASTNSVDMGSDLDIPTPQSSFSLSIKYNAVNGMLSRINAEYSSPSYNPTVTTGFFAVSRLNSSQYKQFENGSLKATISAVSQTPNIYSIVIGAWNRKTSIQDYSTKQCAFASIGDGLTDTEAANFYTAVQAFQTTLSRQL